MTETNALGLPQGPLYLMTEIVRQRERQLTALLAPLELGLHEWRALRIIHAFDGDVPMSVLIEHSQTDRTALGRTIERLVRRGWVSRLPDPDDGRAVLVRRSPAAQAGFEQALAQVAGLDERLLAGLGAGPEEEALTLVLGKLLRAFDGLSRVTQ